MKFFSNYSKYGQVITRIAKLPHEERPLAGTDQHIA